MKKTLLISLIFSLKLLNAQTPCNVTTNKILLAGDSWAWFPMIDSTLKHNLHKYGFTDAGFYSNNTLSVNGKKTKYFLETATLNAIDVALDDNPDIDIINLSIGGNDFLNKWTTAMSPSTSDSLLEAIARRMDTIIMRIWDIDSTVKIHLPMYDFPNFDEVINTSSSPTSHQFYGAWASMGFPTFLEINTQLVNIGAKVNTLANTYPHVTYVNASGLMQNIYGQPTPLGVAPGGTYPADSVPVPGGYPLYPTPIDAMRDYVIFKDAFHLSAEGFDHFYNYNFKKFLFGHMRSKRDTVFSSQGGNKDGYVSNAMVGNNKLAIGLDGSSNLTSPIVSFNAAGINPSDSIHFARIFLKRENLTGSLPVNGKVLLEIKNGYFGTADSIENIDYTDTPTAGDTVCVYGDIENNGHFMRIDIPANLIQHFNKNGLTQFRLTSVGDSIGELFLASGNDTVYPPQIDLFYTPQSFPTASINENSITKNNITIYPNPNSGNILNLNFEQKFNGTVTVFDMTGNFINVSIKNNKIDISNLTKGYYSIMFTENNTSTIKKFIKL
jgi:hypothetical protein